MTMGNQELNNMPLSWEDFASATPIGIPGLYAVRSHGEILVARRWGAWYVPRGMEAEAAEKALAGAPTGEYINITPRGCETPEGTARVNATMKAFDEARENVARVATSLLKTYGSVIYSQLANAKLHDEAAEFRELMEAVEDRFRAEDAFVRAVSGQPRPKPTVKTYPAIINGKSVNVTIPED